MKTKILYILLLLSFVAKALERPNVLFYSDEVTTSTYISDYQDNPPGNIINTADYPYWRELAKTSPMFAAMKASAITIANKGDGETRDVMGANALAYILDPENRPDYIQKITEKFEKDRNLI